MCKRTKIWTDIPFAFVTIDEFKRTFCEKFDHSDAFMFWEEIT